jgi:hypothetical protein
MDVNYTHRVWVHWRCREKVFLFLNCPGDVDISSTSQPIPAFAVHPISALGPENHSMQPASFSAYM